MGGYWALGIYENRAHIRCRRGCEGKGAAQKNLPVAKSSVIKAERDDLWKKRVMTTRQRCLSPAACRWGGEQLSHSVGRGAFPQPNNVELQLQGPPGMFKPYAFLKEQRGALCKISTHFWCPTPKVCSGLGLSSRALLVAFGWGRAAFHPAGGEAVPLAQLFALHASSTCHWPSEQYALR